MISQLLHQDAIQTVEQNITQSVSTATKELQLLQSKLDTNISALDRKIDLASNIHEAGLTSTNDKMETAIFNQTYFNNIASELAENHSYFVNQLAGFNASTSIELRSVVEKLLMLQNQTKFDYTILDQAISAMYSNLTADINGNFGTMNESLSKEISQISQRLSTFKQTMQKQIDQTIFSVESRLMNMNASVSGMVYNLTESATATFENISKKWNHKFMNEDLSIFEELQSIRNQSTTLNETIQSHVLFSKDGMTKIRYEAQELHLNAMNQTENLQAELSTFTTVVDKQLATLIKISAANLSALNMSLSERLSKLQLEFTQLLDTKIDALNMTVSSNFLTLANHTERLGHIFTTGDNKYVARKS